MTLNLPPEIVQLAREKAALAGMADVETFVQRLIENSTPEQAWKPSPDDPRIIAAIREGFASGIGGEMDEEFWRVRREKMRRVQKERSAET